MKHVVTAMAILLLSASAATAQGFTMRLSGDIIVPAGTVHDGTAMTMNGRIQVDGTLRGDAMTMNGDIRISGTVTGSVRAFNGDIFLASSAKLGGDVWAANGRVDRQPGAVVRGKISQGAIFGAPLSQQSPAPSAPSRAWSRWWGGWGPRAFMRTIAAWMFFGFVIIAAILAILFPEHIGHIATRLGATPGQALLAGLALWFLLPPLVLTLVVSIVGIPAVALLPLALTVLGMIGFAGAAMLLGRRLTGSFRRERNPVLDALAGAALLGLVALVPVFGWLAFFTAITWGVGGLLLLLVHRIRKGSSTPV